MSTYTSEATELKTNGSEMIAGQAEYSLQCDMPIRAPGMWSGAIARLA
jgi:hypothetical protein